MGHKKIRELKNRVTHLKKMDFKDKAKRKLDQDLQNKDRNKKTGTFASKSKGHPWRRERIAVKCDNEGKEVVKHNGTYSATRRQMNGRLNQFEILNDGAPANIDVDYSIENYRNLYEIEQEEYQDKFCDMEKRFSMYDYEITNTLNHCRILIGVTLLFLILLFRIQFIRH